MDRGVERTQRNGERVVEVRQRIGRILRNLCFESRAKRQWDEERRHGGGGECG